MSPKPARTFDPDLEDAALAAVLATQPHADRGRLLARIDADDFYQGTHAAAFDAVRILHERDEDVTPWAIAEVLEDHRLGTRPADVARTLYAKGADATSAPLDRLRAAADRRRLRAAACDLLEAVTAGNDLEPHLERIAGLAAARDQASGFDHLGFVDLTTVSTEDIRPTILDVQGAEPLFYAGLTNVIYGDGGTGKTWIGIRAILEATRAGGDAMFLDYEVDRLATAPRLHQVGMTDDEIRRVRYLEGRTFTPAEVRALALAIRTLGIRVVLIDSMGASLAAYGRSENDNGEIGAWYNDLAVPLARAGACVLMIDHVGKDAKDVGNPTQRGAIAKRDRADAAYFVRGATFSRMKAGTVRIIVNKDRHGWREKGDTAAEVTFTPGERLTIDVHADRSRDAQTDTFRPTELMARVSEWREAHPPESEFILADLERDPRPVKGRAEYVRQAVQYLRADGYLATRTERVNNRETTYYRLVRPYSRPAAVPTESEHPSPAVPARPLAVPASVPNTVPPPVPPSGPLEGEPDGDGAERSRDRPFVIRLMVTDDVLQPLS